MQALFTLESSKIITTYDLWELVYASLLEKLRVRDLRKTSRGYAMRKINGLLQPPWTSPLKNVIFQ